MVERRFTTLAALRIIAVRGDVAQLGERRVRNAKVEGSIPFVSTTRVIALVAPTGKSGPSAVTAL